MKTVIDRWRGHVIVKDERGRWVYKEDGTLVSGDPDRACGHCGEPNTPEGHDACLGTLPSVANACCGHGSPGEAYVQLSTNGGPTETRERRRMCKGVGLLVAGVTLGMFVANHEAHARKRPQMRSALVECTAWPWAGERAAGSSLRQLRRRTTGKRFRVVFRVLARGILAIMQGRRLGTRAGKAVWSVRGPKALGVALVAAGCTVTAWKDAISLPAAAKAWVAARSTCYGAGTKNGKPVRGWRCSDAGVTVSRLDAYGPRVIYR